MKSKLVFAGLSAVIIVCVVLLFALSIERKDTDNISVSAPLVEEEPEINLEEITTDAVPEQVIPLEPEVMETLQVSFADVRTLTFWEDRISVGTAEGVFTYHPEDSSYQFFHKGNGLENSEVNTLLSFDGSLLVGTEGGLVQIDPAGNIEKIEYGFSSPVTALAESKGALLIGTRLDGLILFQDNESHQLLDIKAINSIVTDNDHIWVSTEGNGMYSFDGMKWKKRFLVNDTTVFDYVTDLGAKFHRIFAGTPYGLYVFDGGRWDLYNEEDGLLMCDISGIDFNGWKIIVSTSDWGIYEIFEDWVTPRAWSEGICVTDIVSRDNLTVIGTSENGIYIADGTTVENINPSPQTFTRPILALVK